MPVNIEIKGNLARLLATENLIVEHKNVETAQFNTQTRVLTLPMWNTASNYVYDMLVAHEVGHALFTPCVMWKEGKYESLPHSYVNIIEDARIEKLMKNKFAGLNRDFYKGYEELNASDFFELNDKNINDMKFIDKINLYFKLGAFLCLEFNDIENQFITEISQAETFDDVLEISNRVYQYSKQQQESRQKQQEQELAQTSEDNNNEDNDADLDTPSYERDYQSESDDDIDADADLDDPEFDPSDNFDNQEGGGQEAGDWNNIDESDTQEAFDSNSQKLQDRNASETTYVTLPKMNLDNVVISFDTINDYLTEHFTVIEADTEEASPHSYYFRGNGLKQNTKEFREYKKSASKDVNHLVKEFEMKKSADSYARQATARTGVLDTSKLHTYMFNEDIFKKITIIPEGKNHGLVFLLDWSGSMSNILENTLKQLFNLVWFCRKVNIPFEVYAFTNDSWSLDPDTEGLRHYDIKPDRLVDEIKEGALHIDGMFRLVNILTSTAKTKDLDRMMLNLWLQTRAFRGAMYSYARKFALSGTPLNEAIMSTGQITKQFIKTAKLQKCHIIVLTDGEGMNASYNQMRESYYTGKEEMCVSQVPSWSTTIRVGSKSFICKGSDVEFTNKIVEAVKSDIPNCSFIGIRILEKGSSRYFYSRHARLSFNFFEDMKDELRKNGAVFFRNKSFDLWCAIQQQSLHTDTELEVDQGAAKRQITAAFKKMNKNKKSNKFMVKEFIKQIA
tara:strand:- start:643 stop:2844 length:2202 start_codon:yes stop_codon:yes gene_type:complete